MVGRDLVAEAEAGASLEALAAVAVTASATS
jgi:hypothetical protein